MLKILYRKCLLSFFFIPVFLAAGHVYLSGAVGPSYAKLSHSDPQISYGSGVFITDAYPLNNDRSLSVILNVNGGYEFPAQIGFLLSHLD